MITGAVNNNLLQHVTDILTHFCELNNFSLNSSCTFKIYIVYTTTLSNNTRKTPSVLTYLHIRVRNPFNVQDLIGNCYTDLAHVVSQYSLYCSWNILFKWFMPFQQYFVVRCIDILIFGKQDKIYTLLLGN